MAALAAANADEDLRALQKIIGKHNDAHWRERAQRDVARYLNEAKKGMLPNLVSADCKHHTCLGKPQRTSAAHSVMCKKNGKEGAARPLRLQIEGYLRSVANRVREVRAAPRYIHHARSRGAHHSVACS